MLGIRRTRSHVKKPKDLFRGLSVSQTISNSRRELKPIRPIVNAHYKPVAWTIPKPSQHAKDYITQIQK